MRYVYQFLLPGRAALQVLDLGGGPAPPSLLAPPSILTPPSSFLTPPSSSFVPVSLLLGNT